MPTQNLIKEDILPFFGFTGIVQMFEGPSTANAPALSPATNIQTDQSCHLRFRWATQGTLNYVMSGTWKVQVFLERMGGAEFSLPLAHSVNTEPFVAQPQPYVCDIDIPGNTVPAGVYRIVATLTLKGDTGVPAPLAAFADLGIVQFYKEGV